VIEPQQTKTTATQEQKQKVTVTGGALGSWINALIAWGVMLAIALCIVGYCLWQYGGFPGRFVDGAVVTIGIGSGLWFLWTWALNRYYHTQRLYTNSKVIDTQNVTVWFDGPDNYVNFSAEVARQVNITTPVKEVEAWVPPSYEENYAKGVYEAKDKEGLTWEQVAEKFNTTVGTVRGKYKEYIAMLERGRVI
jgi:hypothetical protein